MLFVDEGRARSELTTLGSLQFDSCQKLMMRDSIQIVAIPEI